MPATPAQLAALAAARAARPGDRARNPEALAVARAELQAIKLEAAIRRALAAAPPPTPEQRRRLAELLTGGEL